LITTDKQGESKLCEKSTTLRLNRLSRSI